MKRTRPSAVITGGHGFIGSHIVSRLLAEGYRVLVLDLRAEPPASLEPHDFTGREALTLDITTAEAERAVAGYRPELVVHAAGQVRVGESLADPVGGAAANVMGTLRMLEAARAAGAKGFIFFSSAAVYGEPLELPIPETHPTRPLSPYGVSKLAAMSYVEYYRRAGLLPTATLIPANVYGPGQEAGTEGSVIAAFMDAAISGRPLTVEGDGRQTRDFVYVDDVVEAVWLAWRRLGVAGRAAGKTEAGPAVPAADAGGAWPEAAAVLDLFAVPRPVPGREATFNVGTGLETEVKELAALIERISGRRLGRVALSPRPGDISRSCLHPALARITLGWRARIGLEEGLNRTLVWASGRAGQGPASKNTNGLGSTARGSASPAGPKSKGGEHV